MPPMVRTVRASLRWPVEGEFLEREWGSLHFAQPLLDRLTTGGASYQYSVDEHLFQTLDHLLRPDVDAVAILSMDDPQPGRPDGRRVLVLRHISLSSRVWKDPLTEQP